MRHILSLLSTALVLLASGNALAQDTQATVDAANARCEAARLRKLEPIRQQKIAQCRRSQDQPTAGCETYYSTYGDNSNHVNGSVVRGQFYNLPECVQARELSHRAQMKQNF